jgi:hypothetical protein
MRRRYLLNVVAVAALFLSQASTAQQPSFGITSPRAPDRSLRLLFKDTALIRCMRKAYENDQIVTEDMKGSSAGLSLFYFVTMEHGETEIQALVDHYLLPDSKSTQFKLLKCLDMYHSKELDVLAKKFVPNPKAMYSGKERISWAERHQSREQP